MKGNIKLENISYSYSKNKPIHRNLTMLFKNQNINVIIGKSGSGKTTLVKIMLGLVKPDSGRLYLDNHSYHDLDISDIRNQIAFTNQDTKLFNMTVLENITYGNDLNSKQVLRYLQQFDLDSILPPLNSKVGVNGSNLSKGQAQIVLILRAYFQNKKILILDEPTASLDAKTKQVVLNIIQNISRQDKKTIIIVTHDNNVIQIADKVYRL